MRIAIAAANRRRIGGVEAYLDVVIPALARAGHQVAFWHEAEGPTERPAISLPLDAPTWSPSGAGGDASVDSLAQWRPDVVFTHGIPDPSLEAGLTRVAPSVMFIHAYHGMCISGAKSRLSPTRAPCSRPLGLPCLLHYFPRRCGGLSPATMVRDYELQMRRRAIFPLYRAIITGSSHMRDEVVRNGGDAARVHTVTFPILTPDDHWYPPNVIGGTRATSLSRLPEQWRLLFGGRLTRLKGVELLLDALPIIRQSYSGRVHLTIAGDGPDLPAYRSKAEHILRGTREVAIEFSGWLSDADWRAVVRDHDLLVVPSVWPEPFGLVGPEAGLLGLPAAAFAVGGIPDWLVDGANGHLAPGKRPGAKGLALAIARCLSDPDHYEALRRGARSRSMELTLERHLSMLVPLLASAALSGNELAAGNAGANYDGVRAT